MPSQVMLPIVGHGHSVVQLPNVEYVTLITQALCIGQCQCTLKSGETNTDNTEASTLQHPSGSGQRSLPAASTCGFWFSTNPWSNILISRCSYR